MPPERTVRPPSGTRCKVTASMFSPATNACDSYNARIEFVAISPIMPIRNAQAPDLQAIVAIYNDAIPGRMATADTTPLTTAERESWFAEFDPARRPLWVFTADGNGAVQGWLSLRSFYGRPAYHRTVEVAVYVATTAQRRGIAKSLLQHALAQRRAWACRRCWRSSSDTTCRRSTCSAAPDSCSGDGCPASPSSTASSATSSSSGGGCDGGRFHDPPRAAARTCPTSCG